jgi:outer membrane protein
METIYYTYGVRLQATVPIYQNGSEWSRIRQAKEVVAQRRNELDSARRTAAENVMLPMDFTKKIPIGERRDRAQLCRLCVIGVQQIGHIHRKLRHRRAAQGQ